MNLFNSPKINIVFALSSALVIFIILISTDLLKGLGMAAAVTIWLPFVYALLSIVFYFAINYFFKKGGWIAIVIGIVFNVAFLMNLILKA